MEKHFIQEGGHAAAVTASSFRPTLKYRPLRNYKYWPPARYVLLFIVDTNIIYISFFILFFVLIFFLNLSRNNYVSTLSQYIG